MRPTPPTVRAETPVREDTAAPSAPALTPSRRQLMLSVAAAGVTLATADTVADLLVGARGTLAGTPTLDGPLVAHLVDAATGRIELYVGDRHVTLVDRDLAARLARAAG